MLTIWCFMIGRIFGVSTPNYEQLTADYFFETIWKQKYENYRSIEFDNTTDTTIYTGHVYGCEEWSEEEKKEIVKQRRKEQVELNSRPADVSIKKRSNSKRLKLTIGTKIALRDKYIVQISVYKPFEFVDHY